MGRQIGERERGIEKEEEEKTKNKKKTKTKTKEKMRPTSFCIKYRKGHIGDYTEMVGGKCNENIPCAFIRHWR